MPRVPHANSGLAATPPYLTGLPRTYALGWTYGGRLVRTFCGGAQGAVHLPPKCVTDMFLLKRLALAASVAVLAGGVLSAPAASAAPAQETVAEAQANALGPCNYSCSHPVLMRGHTGSAVRHAQCLLNRVWGYTAVDIDGIFGGMTEAGVRVMQIRCGITEDGIIGPNTWACLHP